jgi:hypothetical protein
MIDIYGCCERIGPELLAEPLNALTNASFLIAAGAAWLLARRLGRLSIDVWVLLGLSFSVGIGSGLWHTLATPWAMMLDVVPILLFVLWFIWVYTRSVAGMPTPLAVAAVIAFLVSSFFAKEVLAVLNPSLTYTPALAAILVLGVFHAQHRRTARYSLLAATGAYALALIFRILDEAVCPAFPIGTHFLWHSLNGLVVYLAMRSVILSCASRSGRGASGRCLAAGVSLRYQNGSARGAACCCCS